MTEGVVGPNEQQGTPLRVLLVEDSEADVKIAQRAFQHDRIATHLFTVGDGQECLDFVRHQGTYQDAVQFPRPDIILLDINMPRVDGFGVLQALKSDKAYSSIPVVVFSASKNQHDVAQSYLLGANSFIQKPVAYEEFVHVIDCFNQYWNVLNKFPARKT